MGGALKADGANAASAYDHLATLREADKLDIVKPTLWRNPFALTHFLSAYARHNVSGETVVEALASILRRAAAGDYGTRDEAIRTIRDMKNRPIPKHIGSWHYFNHEIARFSEQRKETKAC